MSLLPTATLPDLTTSVLPVIVPATLPVGGLLLAALSSFVAFTAFAVLSSATAASSATTCRRRVNTVRTHAGTIAPNGRVIAQALGALMPGIGVHGACNGAFGAGVAAVGLKVIA